MPKGRSKFSAKVVFPVPKLPKRKRNGKKPTWLKTISQNTERIRNNIAIAPLLSKASKYSLATNTVYVYDLQTDTWTQMANMPYKNAFCGITVVQDTIYLIGGMMGYASPTVSSHWAYEPLTDLWKEKAPMPTARGMLSASTLKGKIYTIGGTVNFSTSSFKLVEVYDPQTDAWTTETPMPTSRVSLVTCVFNNKIYAVGGYHYPMMYALILWRNIIHCLLATKTGLNNDFSRTNSDRGKVIPILSIQRQSFLTNFFIKPRSGLLCIIYLARK